MKIGIIAGTRPEVIKLAPVYQEIRAHSGMDVGFCLTGQHGDNADEIAQKFGVETERGFESDCSESSLEESAGRIITRMGAWLDREKPEMVLTQGDTLSTFGGSLAAFLRGIPLGHVEAGLRTHDLLRPFPEEGLRAMISRVATLHFAPTKLAKTNLIKEGINPRIVHLVGNTVIDAMDSILVKVPVQDRRKGLIIATAHRRENWASEVSNLIETLKGVLEKNPDLTLVWVSHPNPRMTKLARAAFSGMDNVDVLEPLPYDKFLTLLVTADLVVTDSGGIQEEAVSIGVPTLVARLSTERSEGLRPDKAELLSQNSDERIEQIMKMIRASPSVGSRHRNDTFGDGRSSIKIVKIISAHLSEGQSS